MIKEIGGLLVHESANFFPILPAEQLEALALDIRVNGLQDPIVLANIAGEKYIIDGRNRAMACRIAGVVPEYKYYQGDVENIFEYVLSTNLHRRQLSVSQRACLAVNVLPMLEENKRKGLSEKMSLIRAGEKVGKAMRSNEIAGQMFSVGAANVSNAKKLKKDRIDLFDMVMAGELLLNRAMQKLKEPVEDVIILEQPDVVEVAQPVASVAPAPVSTPAQLSKSENKKVSELVALGLPENKSIEYVVSKRKVKSTVVKPKSSYAGRVEIKMPEEQKELLMQQAKSNNMSLSEYIRTLINKG